MLVSLFYGLRGIDCMYAELNKIAEELRRRITDLEYSL